jgi:hypothetical protein
MWFQRHTGDKAVRSREKNIQQGKECRMQTDLMSPALKKIQGPIKRK